MPARRRRTLSRSPSQRARMWDKKMNPEVYSKYLESTRGIAMERVISYQVTHEQLIAMVKRIVEQFGTEGAKTHEYMWYAEKLWKLVQTYTGNALQNESDFLYLYYRLKGNSDIILRAIAQSLGIKISSIGDILGKAGIEVGLPPPTVGGIELIKTGEIEIDSDEKTIFEREGDPTLINVLFWSEELGEEWIGFNVEIYGCFKGDETLYHISGTSLNMSRYRPIEETWELPAPDVCEIRTWLWHGEPTTLKYAVLKFPTEVLTRGEIYVNNTEKTICEIEKPFVRYDGLLCMHVDDYSAGTMRIYRKPLETENYLNIWYDYDVGFDPYYPIFSLYWNFWYLNSGYRDRITYAVTDGEFGTLRYVFYRVL
ncbi:MAG: hypothetical protein QXN03_02755 [Desulfurococcaceae archaeon]